MNAILQYIFIVLVASASVENCKNFLKLVRFGVNLPEIKTVNMNRAAFHKASHSREFFKKTNRRLLNGYCKGYT